nr:MAG TPA: hypothetical protein [Caudoviricetes sp.]
MGLRYMATEKYVSQANFEHVWSNLSAMLDKKVSTNDSRLSDARVPRAHTHGNISNVGAITNNAVAVASGDSLLVGDASANNTIVKSSITFGNGSTFLRNDGTWATPANTTYNDLKGATASAAGVHGLVPAPAAGAQAKFLRGDGTWQYTPNDNTTYEVFSGASSTTDGSTGLVPKPAKGDQSKYLRADGVWASPANTDTKVTTTLATTTKAYITGTSNAATSTGSLVFDSGVYLDTTAGSLVATKFKGALSGNADSSTKATNDSLNNPITDYVKSLSVNGRTITITKGDGTTSTITTQDNDHTYNDFTGATSTAGGKNGLVPAPAVGQQGKFLRADGTWATPTDTNDKVTNTLNTAAKAYLTGTTTATTNTGAQVFDTGVYLTENPGELHADKFVGAVSGNAETATSATKATNDAKDQAITGYIRSLSVAGRVITYTKGDGTTGTITTQDTNNTYDVFKAATASAAGGKGLVPAPAKGDQAKFLRADGTWQVPNNTWRPIQDNLTSTATDQSLSANQGKILKGLVDGKAAASHTHKYASGFSVSGTTVTVTYGDGSTSTFKTQDTNNIYDVFKAATADTAGDKGLVPAPAAGDQSKYLQANGTWSTPHDTTYVNFGGATADAAGTFGLVPGPGKGVTNQYLKSTGTWGQVAWGEISGKPSTYPPATHTHNYAGSASAGGSANSAVKLDTATAGSANQPVYFTNGKPAAISYTIQSNVPANAKFTDTTYNDLKGATASAAGVHGLVPAPAKGDQAKFLRADGTWQTISDNNTWRPIQDNLTSTATDQSLSANQGKVLKGLVDGKVDNTEAGANGLLSTLTTSWTATPTDDTYFVRQDTAGGDTFGRVKFSTLWSYIKSKGDSTYQAKGSYAAASHTHNYAGSASAGGSANSAVKLDTATAGSTTQPVYFIGGKPAAIGYTIQSNVPANAKFTDTTYDDATQSTHGLMSVNDKKKVDNMWDVVSISKSLTLKTDWQDTGIAGNNLTSGTYIIQVSGLTTNSTGFYQEVYSGIMTWFADMTNSTTADEIPLHNAGHADNGNEIYLRTIRSNSGTDNSGRLKLQIAAKTAGTKADTIVFKFRRMI